MEEPTPKWLSEAEEYLFYHSTQDKPKSISYIKKMNNKHKIPFIEEKIKQKKTKH